MRFMRVKLQPTVLRLAAVSFLVLLSATLAVGQTTSFTYQGRLTDSGSTANGNYDLQFALFDAESGGTQIGATQTVSNVQVSAGLFTVQIDFGPAAFPGATRFLAIAARVSGTPSFTTLAPRQQITSTPYAIRSLQASSADAVAVSGVPAGSGNYIQNNITAQTANFNISGSGTAGGTLSANAINTTTQYNLGGIRLLGLGPNTGTNNILLGVNAGNSLTDGHENVFIGNDSGQATTGGPLDCATCGPGGTPLYKGSHNTFVGYRAGAGNTASYNTFFGTSVGASVSSTTASNNSFFGSLAGTRSRDCCNSFFGSFAGYKNTFGTNNAFFGHNAGYNMTTGSFNAIFGSFAGGVGQNNNENSFFGTYAGINTEGSGNSFFGFDSGSSQIQGTNNTVIGSRAHVGANNLTNATAIGALARVDQSNALVLGSVSSINGATSSVNVGIGTTTPVATLDTRGTMVVSGNVGIGTLTPLVKLHVVGDALVENTGSGGNISFGAPAGESGMLILKAGISRADLRFDGNTLKLVAATNTTPPAATSGIAIITNGSVGIGTITPPAKLTVKGPGVIDILRVENASGLSGLVVRDDRIVAIGLLSSLEGTLTHVCVDSANRLSFCASSLRYKQQVSSYSAGLDLIRRLNPISFTWKGSNVRDFGLGAEEVAKVEPLLVTHNNEGVIQGVKYDQLNVVLINAVKQQQEQIETLRAENTALNARLRSVERIVGKRFGTQRRPRRKL
jgi:endosialidase-like protein